MIAAAGFEVFKPFSHPMYIPFDFRCDFSAHADTVLLLDLGDFSADLRSAKLILFILTFPCLCYHLNVHTQEDEKLPA